MIESFLQIICDGCGETESDDVANSTYKALRKEMEKYGWRNYGKLDYCRICVDIGKAEQQYSMFVDKRRK